MNKKRILKLANVLENEAGQHGLGFNMGTYLGYADTDTDPDQSGHDCGTVACIAGWTTFLFDKRGRLRPRARAAKDAISTNWHGYARPSFHDTAEDLLGLSAQEADDLFLPDLSDDPTPARAARVLRHLARTGEVDWTIA